MKTLKKLLFCHNVSCCFSYAGILCTGCGKGYYLSLVHMENLLAQI